MSISCAAADRMPGSASHKPACCSCSLRADASAVLTWCVLPCGVLLLSIKHCSILASADITFVAVLDSLHPPSWLCLTAAAAKRHESWNLQVQGQAMVLINNRHANEFNSSRDRLVSKSCSHQALIQQHASITVTNSVTVTVTRVHMPTSMCPQVAEGAPDKVEPGLRQVSACHK